MITRKILCLPQTISSTAGGLVTQTIEQRDNGPLAMLFSERADSLASGGAILADIWVGKRIDGVDNLGSRFLAQVKHGDRLRVYPDGRVEVGA